MQTRTGDKVQQGISQAVSPALKNEDGEKIKVDFSRFTFAPLEGMRGTGAFFITPKENFKHLQSKDPQNTKSVDAG